MTIKRHGVGPRLSQAVVHGNTVYLAGIVASDPSADVKGQTEQILKKIDEHLAATGSHKSRIAQGHAGIAPNEHRQTRHNGGKMYYAELTPTPTLLHLHGHAIRPLQFRHLHSGLRPYRDDAVVPRAAKNR